MNKTADLLVAAADLVVETFDQANQASQAQAQAQAPPTIKIHLCGGVLQAVELVNDSLQYLEIEVVDAEDNAETGADPNATTYVMSVGKRPGREGGS